VPSVRPYSFQLVDDRGDVPSARDSHVVRTHRTPSAMPGASTGSRRISNGDGKPRVASREAEVPGVG
jgi:hypothetical protein